MLTKIEALLKATEELNRIQTLSGIELAFMEEFTLETEKLWVFFYSSKQYVLNRQDKDMVAGNAPIVVDRRSGKLYTTGTAKPIGEYINEIENRI